jgi:type I restriction enzyme M protein
MWNQDNYNDEHYEADQWNRFGKGKPPSSSADWGWVQHILASMTDTGRAAVVLDSGAVSRGSGSRNKNRERDIRQAVVEADWVEGVILLPDNMFYNTTAPGIILLLNRAKRSSRREQMLLVNASNYFEKGKPKNFLTEEGTGAVAEVFRAWETREKLSRVISLEEARKTDYNLSPSQFVNVNEQVMHRSLTDIYRDLHRVAAERERADRELNDILNRLGLNGTGAE